jgi:copper(I)-binding protein
MKILKSSLAALALALAQPAFAADTITVKDAYARFLPGAKAGAAFMVIENSAPEDDHLINVVSDAAERVELHTHKAGEGGMMQMIHVPEGFAIPANGQHALARGGDHVMLMGPTQAFTTGDTLTLTLTFQNAGDVVIEVPVDNVRVQAEPTN